MRLHYYIDIILIGNRCPKTNLKSQKLNPFLNNSKNFNFIDHQYSKIKFKWWIYLSEIPRADRVVQTTGPQFGAIGRDVNTTGAICVPLELSYQSLIVKVPDGNVSVTATAEAYFGVWADRQSVTRRSTWSQFCFNARSGLYNEEGKNLASLTWFFWGFFFFDLR